MINLENRRNQNIGVLGLGVSGLMAARALQRSGANVLAWDDNENQCKEAVAVGIPIVNLYKKSFRAMDALVLAPGIPFTNQPHKLVEKAKVLQRKVLSVAIQDQVPQTEAAIFKLFSTKLHQRLANVAMDILGREGLFTKEYDKSHANGKWEWSYRSTLVDTIGAGTTEIQKNTIAKKSLKLPL